MAKSTEIKFKTKDCQELLENVVTLHSEIYIFGDFNLHLDTSSAVTTSFGDILTAFDLKQHVTFATHIHGHWLNLVINRSTCDTILALTVVDGLADHHTVLVDVKISTIHRYYQNSGYFTDPFIRLTLLPLLIFLYQTLSET